MSRHFALFPALNVGGRTAKIDTAHFVFRNLGSSGAEEIAP